MPVRTRPGCGRPAEHPLRATIRSFVRDVAVPDSGHSAIRLHSEQGTSAIGQFSVRDQQQLENGELSILGSESNQAARWYPISLTDPGKALLRNRIVQRNRVLMKILQIPSGNKRVLGGLETAGSKRARSKTTGWVRALDVHCGLTVVKLLHLFSSERRARREMWTHESDRSGQALRSPLASSAIT